MVNEEIVVQSLEKLQPNIYLMKALAPQIASKVKPSQFCNIKVSDYDFPLLRRPFSVCDVEGDSIFFMFDVHGEGTRLLSEKNKGDKIEIIGPLGNGFIYEKDFDNAVIVAGGLGAAPFPYLTKKLKSKVEIFSFVGGRSKKYVVKYGLQNVQVATDDGTEGYYGTVIDLLKHKMSEFNIGKTILFGCGPTPMLKALQEFAIENEFECQLSTETAMACGFGICQGCPVHSAKEDKYLLVCKDGPVFEARDIKL